MGQARVRGTLEERRAAAVLRRAEIEAWTEYYAREERAYRRWLYFHMTPEQRSRHREEERRRQEIGVMTAAMFASMVEGIMW